jgi:hypothetical protein
MSVVTTNVITLRQKIVDLQLSVPVSRDCGSRCITDDVVVMVMCKHKRRFKHVIQARPNPVAARSKA